MEVLDWSVKYLLPTTVFFAFTWLGVIFVDPNQSYGFRG